MQFTIYSLGDTALFAEILNGIALLFNNGDFVHGDNAMNLSFGAFFGSVMLLTIMLYKSVFNKHIDIKTLLLPLIIYMVLTIPKATIIVDDLYRTETPQKIDNIPLGLALPAAVSSGIAKVLADTLEAVLYVSPINPEATTSGKLTDEGFLTPLQILNAIKYNDLNQSNPLLQKAFNTIYSGCLASNSEFSFMAYQRNPDSFKYVINSISKVDAIVSVPITQAGEVINKTVSCGDAAVLIEGAVHAYMTGDNDTSGLLGMNFKKNMFAERLSKDLNNKGTILKNTNNSPVKYSDSDITRYVSQIVGMSEDQSRAFLTAVTFDPLVKTASACLDEFDQASIAKCTTFITSNEQWKEKSAATATSFYKNMRNGQNILVVIGFLLFPLVVFMIMLQGLGSFRLVTGYLIFITSNYLWIPCAIIINYYSQSTMQEAIFLLKQGNPTAVLTLADAPQLYDAVTTKLSVANNAIGMIPMFTTMLFGGMMWAMSAFTKQVNPAGATYSAKLNSPTIMSSHAIAQGSSLVAKNGYTPATTMGMQSASLKSAEARSRLESELKSIGEERKLLISSQQALSNSSDKTIAHKASDASGSERHTADQNVKTSQQAFDRGGNDKLDVSTTRSTTNTPNKKELTVAQEKNQSITRGVDAQLAANAGLHAEFGKANDDKNNKNGNQSQGSGTGTPKPKAKGVRGLLRKMGVDVEDGGFSIGVAAEIGGEVRTDKRGIMGASLNKVGDDPNNPNQYSFSNSKVDNVSEENTQKLEWSGNRLDTQVNSDLKNKFRSATDAENIVNSSSNSAATNQSIQAQNIVKRLEQLSIKESEIKSELVSIGASANTIGGMVSEFSPDHQMVKSNIAMLNQIGHTNVENWDQKIQESRSIAIKGGMTNEEAINAVAVYYAAMTSGNSEIAFKAYEAVYGRNNITSSLNESNAINFDLAKNTQNDIDRLKESLPTVDTSKAEKLVDETAGKLDPYTFSGKIEHSVVSAIGLSHQNIRSVEVLEAKDLNPVAYDQLEKEVQDFYREKAETLKKNGDAVIQAAVDRGILDESFTTYLSDAEKNLRAAQAKGDHDEAARQLLIIQQVHEKAIETLKDGQAQIQTNYARHRDPNAVATTRAELEKQQQQTDAELIEYINDRKTQKFMSDALKENHKTLDEMTKNQQNPSVDDAMTPNNESILGRINRNYALGSPNLSEVASNIFKGSTLDAEPNNLDPTNLDPTKINK